MRDVTPGQLSQARSRFGRPFYAPPTLAKAPTHRKRILTRPGSLGNSGRGCHGLVQRSHTFMAASFVSCGVRSHLDVGCERLLWDVGAHAMVSRAYRRLGNFGNAFVHYQTEIAITEG